MFEIPVPNENTYLIRQGWYSGRPSERSVDVLQFVVQRSFY